MDAIDPATSYDGFEGGTGGGGGRDGATADDTVSRFLVSSWVASRSLSESRGFTKPFTFFCKVFDRSPS